MGVWWSYSPFFDIAVYMGGNNRSCSNKGLIGSWVNQVSDDGWGLIPIWVGPQAPCAMNQEVKFILSSPSPFIQGQQEAAKAIAAAHALSSKLEPIVYYDMENYATVPPPLITTCQIVVRGFLNGWISGMKSAGYQAGVYGNVAPAAFDFSELSPLPDDAWITVTPTSSVPPSVTIWNLASRNVALCDKYSVPSCPNLWSTDQRIHQYLIDEYEDWGGTQINIDADIVDAGVAIPHGKPKTFTFNFSAFYPDGTITSPLSINNIGIARGNYGNFINGSNSDIPGSIGQILDNWQFWVNNMFEGQGNGLYNPDTTAFNLLPNYDPAGQCGNNAYCTTVMNGMNNAGQTVGSWTDSNSKIHGFVYSGGLNGSFTSFDYSGATSMFPTAINDAGLVAGYYVDSNHVSHGFLYNANTQQFVAAPLDYPGATGTAAYGVNGYGQITGTYSNGTNSYGFFYSNGSFLSLSINCGTFTIPTGINDNEQIVGWEETLGAYDGFMWDYTAQTCNALSYPSSYNTQAYSINDAGQISGSWNIGGQDANGFVAVPQTP